MVVVMVIYIHMSGFPRYERNVQAQNKTLGIRFWFWRSRSGT